MAFERAKIQIKAASIGTGLKVTLSKFRGSPAQMKFTIGDSQSKAIGWVNGDRLEVLIGTGEHHGIIRMRKNNSIGDATVVSRKALKGSFIQISLGHQVAFVDRAEPGRWCQFEHIEDGYLEIILPRWADETAPKRPQAPVSAPVSPPKPAVPRASSTASLMGDPPPGRRDMLAKIGELKA